MKEKYLIEKYLLLKIINKYPGSTRYWLRGKLSKLGCNLYDELFKKIFDVLVGKGWVRSVKQDHSSFVYITDNGVKGIQGLEYQIKFILSINV